MEFVKALPIWLTDLEREKNITCGLWTSFDPNGEKVILRATACSLYRAFLNGRLVAYGPARAPHHHFRVDEWDLTALCRAGQNDLYIEAAGYNINTFYTLDQPSFVQAELTAGDRVLAATGADGFAVWRVTERVQKTPKYSFQRPFTEAWRLTPAYAHAPEKSDPVSVQPQVAYLPRYVQYPAFAEACPVCVASQGIATDGHKREHYRRDRAVVNISPLLKGFPLNELEVNLNDLAQEFDYVKDGDEAPVPDKLTLAANRYAVYGYERIDAGFPAFHVECPKSMTLWLIWDEMLTRGDADFNRHIECVNALRLELDAGSYDFTGFEAYAYMGMKFIALGGECTLSRVRLIEYAAPLPAKKPCPVNDPEIQTIYEAAVNCFRLSCLESYSDDPSRERNDCLFDSYFMGAAEKLLTGASHVEHNMMEAFALAKDEDLLPLCGGQLPCMYPGDHYDSFYSPTHQMWMVMQLRDYVRRTGDTKMADALKDRLFKGYAYFESFANEDGLLENLVGWVFLDWQEANDAAALSDLSYTANMLYAGMLDAMEELYGGASFAEEAKRIRQTVRAQSLKDGVFHDCANRNGEGKLTLTEVVTQSCQTYAFLMGVADPETDKALLQKVWKCAPGMSPQHALTQSARLKVILTHIGRDAFLSELKRVFLDQAQKTGSLWEDDTPVRNLIEAIHSEIVVMIDSLREKA